MSMFRTQNESNMKVVGENLVQENRSDEWLPESENKPGRDLDPIWEERYQYESTVIRHIIQTHNVTKILELGSGPGRLSQIIQEKETVKYHLVDKINAKKTFDLRKYSGKFFVKDLMNHFDVNELDDDYGLVIMNDFLEHIANPSNILSSLHKIMKKNGILFIGVPNWRMGHVFIYRGLFDFDNFVYFTYIHGFNSRNIYPSDLKCQFELKLDSEDALPDEFVNSWNWYFELIRCK